MYIYVVKSGDTLTSIANNNGTTVQRLVELNGVTPNAQVVIGEALLIPSSSQTLYVVNSGDTLYKIAKKYGTTPEKLASLNGIGTASVLQIGQKLKVPASEKKSIEVNGYVQATSTTYKKVLVDDTRENIDVLTYVAPFSFEIREDGTLKAPPLEPIISIAKENGTIPMLVLTNIVDGSFNTKLASTFLNDKTIQQKLITNIISEARKFGMRDVHFDLENVAPKDKEAYNQFLRNVKSQLPSGYTLSTTLVPKYNANQKGAFYEAHDYKSQGQIVDFVVIMTYDWGWQGGPPQAISPIREVKRVLEYAKSEMPASKIMMGQNLYGFDWTLPFKEGNPPAKAVSQVGAMELASRKNATIEYDEKAQAPFFYYTDDSGSRHVVWFEDARSFQAKFNLVKEEGIRGISYWKMGLRSPQNWNLLRDSFYVKKNG